MTGQALVQSEPWMRRGQCVVEDIATEVFYPTRGVDTTLPKSICERCAVRRTCLDYALDNGEEFGIWGGESERARRRILKRRRAMRELVRA